MTTDAPKVEQVALADIRTDGGTQARAKLDDATVEEYAALIGTGANVPPVVVFYDGGTYWLADGFHRVAARAKVGRSTVRAEVHAGTREDAQWYACGANKAHGLRRSRSDAQRAIDAIQANGWKAPGHLYDDPVLRPSEPFTSADYDLKRKDDPKKGGGQ